MPLPPRLEMRKSEGRRDLAEAELGQRQDELLRSIHLGVALDRQGNFAALVLGLVRRHRSIGLGGIAGAGPAIGAVLLEERVALGRRRVEVPEESTSR